jgi:hypothetical protein
MTRPAEADPGSICVELPLMWWVVICSELGLAPTASCPEILETVRLRGRVLPGTPANKASPTPPLRRSFHEDDAAPIVFAVHVAADRNAQ